MEFMIISSAIAEEMIMNSIFHAPIDWHGKRRYAHVDRSRTVMLEEGQQAVLRWTFDDEYVAVSVRDPFGSLSPSDLVGALGREGPLAADPSRIGAGLGLEI